MPRPPHSPGSGSLRLGRFSEADRSYLITTVTEGRVRWFAEFAQACSMARLIASEGVWSGASLEAWVLMPDHVHVLMTLPPGSSLSTVVGRAFGRCAHAFNRRLGRRGALWQRGFHDRAIRTDENLRDAARYIIANPLRAGLVDDVGDYSFWGMRWAGEPGFFVGTDR
jgi:putative transposase